MASSCKKGYYFCNTSQECKKIPRGHKVQSDGELVREYVSDWRSDLQETDKLEDAMIKLQNADKKRLGIKDNPDNDPEIQKSNNAILKNQGLGHSMTRTGKYINYGATVKSQIDKVTKETQKPEHKDKLKARGTSAAEMKKTGDDLAWRAEREVNRNIPDTFYHQAKGIENKIELNTSGAKKDANKNKGRVRIGVTNNEELQGGVSVEPYTKDTKFLEIETVDIIKPKALNASDWRGDLEVIDEGAGKIASKIIKSPSVKKFVGNLSKKSPIKVLGRSGTPKRAAYNPNLTLKPHEAPGAARDIVTKSQGATMKGGVKNTTWKSDSKHNWGSIKNPVKVYKQPTYAKPDKYPGDKTGAYARELARQDNTARIGKRGRISKDGLKLDPSKQGFANTVGGKTKLNPARGLEDKTIEFLKKFKESYSLREGNRTRYKGVGLSGSGNKKDMSKGPNEAAPVDYRSIQAKGGKQKSSPKKNTGLGDFEPSGNIYAGYEPEGNNLAEAYLNEFNQLRDFVEELASEGYSVEEIYNHLTEDHELREAPVLKVLAEKVKLIQGAISGLRKIPAAIKTADKWGRNTWKFLKKVDSQARPIVKSGIEKTANALKSADQWGRKALPPAVERGKKDLKKVSDFTQQAYSSLEKNVGQPLLTKGKGDIAKWKKTQEVIKRANRLARTKAEKSGQIVDIAPTTTNLPQAKKSLPLTKTVTKGMSPKEIRSKGMNLLAKLQGKTPKQQKAKELTNRMSKAVDSSKKPTTYSGKVDAAKNLPDPGAIVKSSSSAVTAVKPSLDTTKGINMSLSSMASKVKNLLTGTKATKQITGTKTPNVLTGTKTKQLELPISTKKKSSKLIPTAIATGIVAGSTTTSQKKDKSVVASDPSKINTTKDQPKIDPPNKNKAIVDTEKKKVDPQKNPVVSKVVDTYKTGKETKSKDLNPWGRSKQYKAKDGTVVDRSDVFTKAAFDFGPNIKKGEKIGVIGHGQRKKYDIEATRRKSVKESAALEEGAVGVLMQLPKAFRAVSVLKNASKGNAIKQVFGKAKALRDVYGVIKTSKKDAEIPRDEKVK